MRTPRAAPSTAGRAVSIAAGWPANQVARSPARAAQLSSADGRRSARSVTSTSAVAARLAPRSRAPRSRLFQRAARPAGAAPWPAAAAGPGAADGPLEAWLKAGDSAVTRPAVPSSASVSATVTARLDVLRTTAGTFPA